MHLAICLGCTTVRCKEQRRPVMNISQGCWKWHWAAIWGCCRTQPGDVAFVLGLTKGSDCLHPEGPASLLWRLVLGPSEEGSQFTLTSCHLETHKVQLSTGPRGSFLHRSKNLYFSVFPSTLHPHSSVTGTWVSPLECLMPDSMLVFEISHVHCFFRPLPPNLVVLAAWLPISQKALMPFLWFWQQGNWGQGDLPRTSFHGF